MLLLLTMKCPHKSGGLIARTKDLFDDENQLYLRGLKDKAGPPHSVDLHLLCISSVAISSRFNSSWDRRMQDLQPDTTPAGSPGSFIRSLAMLWKYHKKAFLISSRAGALGNMSRISVSRLFGIKFPSLFNAPRWLMPRGFSLVLALLTIIPLHFDLLPETARRHLKGIYYCSNNRGKVENDLLLSSWRYSHALNMTVFVLRQASPQSDDNKDRAIFSVCAVFLLISSIGMAARLASKWEKRSPFSVDDLLIIWAYVSPGDIWILEWSNVLWRSWA